VNRTPSGVEWPTVFVFAGSIGLGSAAVVFSHRLPLVVTLVLLAMASTWYQSFQHEVLHGHPTPWRWVNEAMASAPLGLATPYWMYRDTHLAHHREDLLTDPDEDPESYYTSPQDWDGCAGWHRALLVFRRTLLGRVVVGPPMATRWVLGHFATLRGGRRWLLLARWLGGCAVVLVTVDAAGLAWWKFAIGSGHLGMSLTMVRSFAEHRAGPPGYRTAVVQGRGLLALLYLNNNLHVTHHRRPDLAWYRIPAAVTPEDVETASLGAGLYRSYWAIVRLYAFRPFCRPIHPYPVVAA
jgi:fatty acid desaturase